MPCYHPLPGWYARDRNASGKRSIVFSADKGFTDRPASVPCGSCIGCQLERSRQWAVRCVHESKMWDDNCFVTLTYEKAPNSLVPRDFQEFLKRLRWHKGAGIRFFGCGEYGEELERPHYHALLFNCEFTDRRWYKESGGIPMYTSAELERIWGHGICVVGAVSFESAAYIARYSLKKVVGPAADGHYKGRVPEFLRMSRRPGIGSAFVEKFRRDMYPSDECVVRGKVSKPPRFYDDKVAAVSPSVMSRIKSRRRAAANRSVDNTGARLIVREAVKESAMQLLSRHLEV